MEALHKSIVRVSIAVAVFIFGFPQERAVKLVFTFEIGISVPVKIQRGTKRSGHLLRCLRVGYGSLQENRNLQGIVRSRFEIESSGKLLEIVGGTLGNKTGTAK